MPDSPQPSPSLIRRVLFVGKYGLDDAAGNSVAIRRLRTGYAEKGIESDYIRVGGSAGDAAFALFGSTPDVVHALHAGDAAELGGALAKAIGAPLVVTLTGTDISGGVPADVAARLLGASAVVALTDAQAAAVRGAAPSARVTLIRQSVVLGDEPSELLAGLEVVLGGGIRRRPIALLPGGLRPVKDQMRALDAFEHHANDLGDWFLVLAGPPIDEAYAEDVRARARSLPNAMYVGEIPHDSIPAALRECRVLLNTSDSEGEAQTVLEAQCVGTPVVARDIVGMRHLVEPGVSGWFFETPAQLAASLGEIEASPDEALRRAATARSRVVERLNVTAEVDAHLALYKAAVKPEP